MNLSHLRCFIAVAEEEHVTRAAERLGMQQPPLSQRIKSIERELDIQLFRKKGRGLELTEAGRHFLEGSRAVLAQLAKTIDETRSTARGMRGQICVGFVPTCPFHPFVPRVIRAFREAFPRVSLVLEECLGSELKEKLHTRKLDAGLLRASVSNAEGLRVDPLLEEPVLAALPYDHPLAQTESAISLQSLAEEPFIIYGAPGSGIYEMIVQGCRAAGFSPRIYQYAPRLTSMINLVATGLGVSLVPASLRRMHMENVKYIPLGGTQPRAVLNLVSRRGDVSPVVKHLLDLTSKSARSFRTENPEAELR